MSDNYQAIYAAVRSRIGNVDAYAAIAEAARNAFDVGNLSAIAQESIGIVRDEMTRPSVLFRPSISLDGNQWCALYGEDLQAGVAGFGDSPSDAMAAFDKAWVAAIEKGRSR